MTDAIVHVSQLAGAPLLDSRGERLGRVQDAIARFDLAHPLPPVTGLRARIGGRDVFLPIERIASLGPGSVRTNTTKLNLAQFEQRPGEVQLRRDLLDRSLINITTARLVTAREVELVCRDGAWRVTGIDPSVRARLWRLWPRRFRGHDTEHPQFVSWTEIEPLVSHVPGSRLKLASRRLIRLHPAQIADLVESASHREGEEILAAVGQDKELEADVFEELDDEHQVEFLQERSDQQAADVLARMAPDDAADLLMQMEQDRRLPILDSLPLAKQVKIRRLLGHNPSTAGGLMNPDFMTASAAATAGETVSRVRSSGLGPAQLLVVCLLDDDGRHAGALQLAEVVCAEPDARLGTLLEAPTPAVGAEADLPEIAQLMSDYNLIAMPVLDTEGRPVGVVGVDDVLELLVPEEWRRRTGSARR
jgi:hypothetical protein